MAQRREVPGRFGQPVNDDELPLAAHRGECRGEWPIADGIRSTRLTHGYPKVPSGDGDGGRLRWRELGRLRETHDRQSSYRQDKGRLAVERDCILGPLLDLENPPTCIDTL